MKKDFRAGASNGSHVAETSLSVLIRKAALNELTLVALVVGITSSLFQMSAPSNERTAAYGKSGAAKTAPAAPAAPLQTAMKRTCTVRIHNLKYGKYTLFYESPKY